MIKKTLFLILLLVSNFGISQEIKKYAWDEKPVFETIPEVYKNQPAVVLFDKRWIHTRVGYYAFANFVMNHTAIKINSAEEINKYNKVKAEDNGYVRDLKSFHARIIKPNGEIKIIPEDKIVQAEVNKVKSIVFEGVEAGDILEYYFVLKEFPSSYGVEVFQKEIPVLHAEFITTKEGVNIETLFSKEFSVRDDKDKKILTAKNIPPFVEESNSKNLKNLIKLIYLINVPSVDNFSWKTFLPAYFGKPSFNNMNKSQAKKLIEKIDLKSGSTDEKITKIDAYIKENFDFVGRGEKAERITALTEGKLKLTSNDVFDLYGFILKEIKIPYQIAIGMSRFTGELSESKYVPPLSQEFMYYIPETNKFISPSEKYLSYGYPIFEVQGSQGLLYTPKQNFTGAKITFPIVPADYTVIETEIKVALSDDFSQATIDKTKASNGYEGQLLRNNIKYLQENEEEKELIDFIKNRTLNDLDVKIVKYSFENQEFKNNYSNKPFLIKLKAELNESLTENAGNLLIVNLGKTIGKQSNLYQETQRKTDVDISFAKTYKHRIIFTIPSGYEIESYADLIIDKKLDKNQKCFFKSEVKVEGNQLIVDVLEIYENITYSLENYQEYRNVINAASEFTKGNVILKLKK